MFRASSSDDLTCRGVILTHIFIYILAFVSVPQTTLRTCRNIPSCFAPLDGRGDRTNQLHWLKLLHTSYIFLLSQTAKGRVFYSIDKCFETRADPRNIFDKEILKVWTPCLPSFYCGISRATLAWSLNACAIAKFWKSARARGLKTIGSHLKGGET